MRLSRMIIITTAVFTALAAVAAATTFALGDRADHGSTAQRIPEPHATPFTALPAPFRLDALLGARVKRPAVPSRTATTCPSRGLDGVAVARAAYRVLRVETTGLTCTNALRVAGALAAELRSGKAITVPGSVGVAVSSASCTGCAPRTQVTITYLSGRVTVSFAGAPHAGTTLLPALREPSIRLRGSAFPTFPSPLSPLRRGGSLAL